MKLEIFNVWANAIPPTGSWYSTIYCRRWHQRLRLLIIKALIKSLYNGRDICQARTDAS